MSEIFTRAFLNTVLDREEIARAKLDALIGIDEGQFHEFKGGPTTKRMPPEILREYLAGFANAEGGVLLLGVTDEPPRTVVGTAGWLPGNPATWAVQATRDLLPFLATPPVFMPVDYGGHTVLLAAVERSPLLVPCIEDGRSVYYYRSGSSTFPMRESLMADLILGRRRGPTMAITAASLDCTQPNSPGVNQLHFSLTIDNESFGFASDLSAGIVTWALRSGPYSLPNSELLRAVEMVKPSGEDGLWIPTFLRRSTSDQHGDPVVRPFATRIHIPFGQDVRVPQRRASVRFAAYLAPRDCAPQWFQCSLDWSPDTSPSTQRTMKAIVERVHRARPVAAWIVDNS
jgi:hypothetical protein